MTKMVEDLNRPDIMKEWEQQMQLVRPENIFTTELAAKEEQVTLLGIDTVDIL